MDQYTIGSLVFVVVVAVFLLVWFKKNFVTSVVISGVITSFGILLLPNSTLHSFYFVFWGDLYYYEISMNMIKLFTILGLVLSYIILKYRGEKLEVDL